MSKLNIYIKSHLKIFQCICRMERFLDLYIYCRFTIPFYRSYLMDCTLLVSFSTVGTLLYVSPFFPLRLPCGGAVLHKVKTLQQWGIYTDVISLRF